MMTGKVEVTFETDRMYTRRFCINDISNKYLSWLNDVAIMRYSNQRFIVHTFESCKKYLKSFEHSDNLFLAILEKGQNTLLGTMTCYIDKNHKTVDIGLLIGESRKGYGSEIYNKAIEVMKDGGKIRKITGGANEKNKAMIRIMEKAGLEKECSRPRQEILDGREVAVNYYSLYC